MADLFRADLLAAGVGDGRHGFSLQVESRLFPPGAKALRVQDAGTLADIEGSPMPLEGRLLGRLEEVSHRRISGWAWNTGDPATPVELRVSVDGQAVATVVANRFRQDLERANIGFGYHSFSIDAEALALPLAPALVRVAELGTGLELDGSPGRLETPLELNASARAAVAALIASPGSVDELQARAAFLAEQQSAVRQRVADLVSDRKGRTLDRALRRHQRPKGAPVQPARRQRALVIGGAVPDATRDARASAVLSHMLSLQRLGFDVVFSPAEMVAAPGAGALLEAGIAVLDEPWTSSVEEVLRRQRGEFDLVYLQGFAVAGCYLRLVQLYCPTAKIVYGAGELQHVRLLRQAEAEDRPELKAVAARVQYEEFVAAASCHACLVHSAADARLIQAAVPAAKVAVAPWAVRVGVREDDPAARSGVGFAGCYDNPAELDAAVWLVDTIMPAVWQTHPDMVCRLGGSGMPRFLERPDDPRIRVAGPLVDREGFWRAVRVAAAPLSYGAGVQAMVVESFAAGVPCVCTGVAAEGLDLPPPLDGLVVAGAEAIAAKIIEVHEQAAMLAACRRAGLDLVSRAFSEAVVDDALRWLAG